MHHRVQDGCRIFSQSAPTISLIDRVIEAKVQKVQHFFYFAYSMVQIIADSDGQAALDEYYRVVIYACMLGNLPQRAKKNTVTLEKKT